MKSIRTAPFLSSSLLNHKDARPKIYWYVYENIKPRLDSHLSESVIFCFRGEHTQVSIANNVKVYSNYGKWGALKLNYDTKVDKSTLIRLQKIAQTNQYKNTNKYIKKRWRKNLPKGRMTVLKKLRVWQPRDFTFNLSLHLKNIIAFTISRYI